MFDSYLVDSSDTDISLSRTGNVILVGKYWYGHDYTNCICFKHLFDWN